MPWLLAVLSALSAVDLALSVTSTAAIKSMTGTFQERPLLVHTASTKLPRFELMQLFAETSSEWCCWACLTKPGTIRAITGTLMHLKDAGPTTIHSRSCLQPVSLCMHQILCPYKSGVGMLTQHWRMPCGFHETSANSAVARWLYTRLQAL